MLFSLKAQQAIALQIATPGDMKRVTRAWAGQVRKNFKKELREENLSVGRQVGRTLKNRATPDMAIISTRSASPKRKPRTTRAAEPATAKQALALKRLGFKRPVPEIKRGFSKALAGYLIRTIPLKGGIKKRRKSQSNFAHFVFDRHREKILDDHGIFLKTLLAG